MLAQMANFEPILGYQILGHKRLKRSVFTTNLDYPLYKDGSRLEYLLQKKICIRREYVWKQYINFPLAKKAVNEIKYLLLTKILNILPIKDEDTYNHYFCRNHVMKLITRAVRKNMK